MSASEKEPTVTKDNSNLAPGDVVSGLESSELVEIQRIAPFGGKTLVEGVGLQSRRIVRRPLAADELAALVKVRGQQHSMAMPGFSSSEPRQSASASLTSSTLSSRSTPASLTRSLIRSRLSIATSSPCRESGSCSPTTRGQARRS